MNVQSPDLHDAPTHLPLADVLVALDQALAVGEPLDGTVLQHSAFDRLRAMFGLTEAETMVIALLAGHALSHEFAETLADRTGHSTPIAGGLISLLTGLTWESLAAGSVLRAWFLVQMHGAPTPREAALSIDTRLLDWCLGLQGEDHRLRPYLREMSPAAILAQDHADQIGPAATTLAETASQQVKAGAIILGDGPATRERIAADIAHALGMRPLVLCPSVLTGHAADTADLLRLIAREAVLSRALPVVALPELGAADLDLLRQIEGPVIVLAEQAQPRLQPGPGMQVIALTPPDRAARAALWQAHLQLDDLESTTLAEDFAISADDIAHICEALAADNPAGLAQAARTEANRHLAPPPDPLIQEIRGTTDWADLILPPAPEATLRAIAAQARHRAQVYRQWQFAKPGARGLGITALFTGPSGTGKTLAAEVLANDLGQRLLRVNLAQVVDKYVGETEKHLDHVFGLAERSGAILLFDEAEALFRQRGDGDSGQERFASMTVAYLLQRLECCTATCLLTTNLRSAIDDAFLRRLRFVVQFAFPGKAERRRLWQSAFPTAAPVGPIDTAALASLPATGGTIRNAALNAAFLAADTGGPIEMAHILIALEQENTKLSQPIDLGPLRRRIRQ